MLATELNTLAMAVTAVPARLPRFWEIHWDTSDSFWETILGSRPSSMAKRSI